MTTKRTQKSWWQKYWKYVLGTVALPLILAFLQFVAPELIKNSSKTDITETEQSSSINLTPVEPIKVFGPINATLQHNADDDLINVTWAKRDLLNFKVEARFLNPFDAAEHDWDYGFSFRQTALNDAFRFYVTSQKRWTAVLRRIENGKSINQPIAGDRLDNLNTGAGQSNDLVLIVKDETAELFVNNSRIDTFYVGDKMVSGDIGVGTGYENGHQVEGKTTLVERFQLYEYK